MRATGMRAVAEQAGDPDRLLMASILDDAVAAYRAERPGSTPSPLFQAIHRWVEDTDRTYRFSFESVCTALALDADHVRGQLRTLRPPPGTVPPGPDGEAADPARPGDGGPTVASGTLATVIGANVRRRREAAGIAVAALASQTGLTAGELTALEAGDLAPGLRVVWQVAVALAVPFGALLEQARPETPPDPDFRVQRGDDGRQISSPQGLRSRVLFGDGAPRVAEVYELTLAAGAVDDASGHAPGTFEHLVVTRGTLVVGAGGREATLHERDAILFRADAAHRYANPGPDETRALLVMVYP